MAPVSAPVSGGVEIERVGHYMGHTDPRTTRRYAKLSGEGLADVPRHGPRPVGDTDG